MALSRFFDGGGIGAGGSVPVGGHVNAKIRALAPRQSGVMRSERWLCSEWLPYIDPEHIG